MKLCIYIDKKQTNKQTKKKMKTTIHDKISGILQTYNNLNVPTTLQQINNADVSYRDCYYVDNKNSQLKYHCTCKIENEEEFIVKSIENQSSSVIVSSENNTDYNINTNYMDENAMTYLNIALADLRRIFLLQTSVIEYNTDDIESSTNEEEFDTVYDEKKASKSWKGRDYTTTNLVFDRSRTKNGYSLIEWLIDSRAKNMNCFVLHEPIRNSHPFRLAFVVICVKTATWFVFELGKRDHIQIETIEAVVEFIQKRWKTRYTSRKDVKFVAPKFQNRSYIATEQDINILQGTVKQNKTDFTIDTYKKIMLYRLMNEEKRWSTGFNKTRVLEEYEGKLISSYNNKIF